MKAPPIDYIQGSDKWWKTTEDCIVELSNGDTITIPKGFITDLASVPRLLWWLVPPFGDHLLAVIVHDYLYIYDFYREEMGDYKARRFIDQEMFRMAAEMGTAIYICNLLYYFVRWFGRNIFKKWHKEGYHERFHKYGVVDR